MATISVCMPSIFHLVKRGLYHGIPSLFRTQDPSEPIGGDRGEHIGRLGNPVDSDTMHFQRLTDPGKKSSMERLFSWTTATRTSETISENLPLEHMYVRNDVDVQSVRKMGTQYGNRDSAV